MTARGCHRRSRPFDRSRSCPPIENRIVPSSLHEPVTNGTGGASPAACKKRLDGLLRDVGLSGAVRGNHHVPAVGRPERPGCCAPSVPSTARGRPHPAIESRPSRSASSVAYERDAPAVWRQSDLGAVAANPGSGIDANSCVVGWRRDQGTRRRPGRLRPPRAMTANAREVAPSDQHCRDGGRPLRARSPSHLGEGGTATARGCRPAGSTSVRVTVVSAKARSLAD